MNKQDYVLIAIIILIVAVMFYLFKINEKDNINKALVYYEDNLIQTINLNSEEKEYIVKGYNGDVLIKAGNGKIKVEQENSPQNLCSKQGYISKSYETIVCLPNKIVIKLESDSEIDTIAG